MLGDGLRRPLPRHPDDPARLPVGFGIPALQLTGLPTDPVVLGGIALGLSYSAYVAEVYRAGIRSVHRGQRDAALAVGLTEAQAMRHVILPQAVRRVAPPLLNDFVALQKDVALVSILGPQEAFRIAQIIQGKNFNYTPLIAAALLYLAGHGAAGAGRRPDRRRPRGRCGERRRDRASTWARRRGRRRSSRSAG